MQEGGLVVLPMLALGFALLDYPLAIFIQNTLRNAVREGTRFAITQQTDAGRPDAAIKSVVKGNSMGFLTDADLNASPARSTITIEYYNPNTLAVSTGVGSNGSGQICVVTAMIKRSWMAPLWRGAGLLTFTASSSDLMEAPPNGVLQGR